jgi:hypothetical protein
MVLHWMDVNDFQLRGCAAPRRYTFIDPIPPSRELFTVHQFYVDGLYYGRIWSPNKSDHCLMGLTRASLSGFDLNGTTIPSAMPSSPFMQQSFVVKDALCEVAVVFVLLYVHSDANEAGDANGPAIMVTVADLDGLGRASPPVPFSRISLARLKEGGFLTVQHGRIVLEIERATPWDPRDIFRGRRSTALADYVAGGTA